MVGTWARSTTRMLSVALAARACDASLSCSRMMKFLTLVDRISRSRASAWYCGSSSASCWRRLVTCSSTLATTAWRARIEADWASSVFFSVCRVW